MRTCYHFFIGGLLSLLASCSVSSPSGTVKSEVVNTPSVSESSIRLPSSPPPAIYAKSAIVVDAKTGRPLYQKNADERRQVASTQKLVTALVVTEKGNLSKKVTIQPCDLQVEPTRINFKPGDTYERGELLRALMVKSCNDVACALGRDVAGSVNDFTRMMNSKARSIGMKNSNFLNPHGLTEPGQYSTARDMARCALVAYRQPVIRQFINTENATFNFSSGESRTLKNTNRLLHNISWCNGMKTGTTKAAGRCLIASGSYNGMHVIVVVLGSNSTHIWKDSETLLKWAVGV